MGLYSMPKDQELPYDDKENLNKVASSEPINKTAMLVTLKGVEYVTPKTVKKHKVFSENPLPTRPVCKHGIDLTGKKFGRLEVVGLYVKRKIYGNGKRKQGIWVVRCCCGNYETRTARGLRGHGEQQNLMCIKCQYEDGVIRGNWNKQ